MKPAKHDTRVTFSGALMTAKDSTVKANENSYEDYEFPEDLNITSRYQRNPVTVVQQNPVNGVSQFSDNTDAIYDDVK